MNKKIIIVIVLLTLTIVACGEADLLWKDYYGKSRQQMDLEATQRAFVSPISPISPVVIPTPTWEEWSDDCVTGWELECNWWWQ